MSKSNKKEQTFKKTDRGSYVFTKAYTKTEREAADLFLLRHNSRGYGSTAGYRVYYIVMHPPDEQPLVDRMVAVAKFCPLHTPAAAKFFAGQIGDSWKHVYCLQRLAAYGAPKNLLSSFISWCLKELGKDKKIWYVATYGDSKSYAPDGRSAQGWVYRAANFTYCGISNPKKKIEGYILNGLYHSIRKGGRTLRKSEIPIEAKIIYSGPKYRWCKAVGSPLARMFRQRELEKRMAKYKFDPVYQPRLLCRLTDLLLWLGCWVTSGRGGGGDAKKA